MQYEANANVQFSWYESIGCLDKLRDFVVHENDKWLKPETPFYWNQFDCKELQVTSFVTMYPGTA